MSTTTCNSAIRWNPDTQIEKPRAMLKRYREERKQSGRLRRYRQMKLEWPDTENTLLRVLEYFTDGLVFRDGTAVVYRAGDDMLEIYREGWKNCVPTWERLHKAAFALANGIALSLQRIQLVSPENKIWRPQDGVPLTEWLRTHGTDLTVQEGKADPVGVLRAVTRHTFTGSMTQILGHKDWAKIEAV